MKKRMWMNLPLCIGLIACGGLEESGQLNASLEDGTLDGKDEEAGDPGTGGANDPGDKDPGDHKDDPGAGCGDPGPPALCSDKGLACSVIADKENLCGDGLEPIWELACGDNEVCCAPIGTADPGEPGDPNEPKPDEPGAGDPSDPGTGEPGK